MVVAGNFNYVLSDTALTIGTKTLTLSGLEVANLTGGTSANTFTVSGWTGTGSLIGGDGSDVVAATKDGLFTLTDSQLSTADGMSLALDSIAIANLTGGVGNDTFDLLGWTGDGTIQGGGTGDWDTLLAQGEGSFTLTNTSLAITGRPTLALAAIEAAHLTGGGGDDTFTVSGWTGGGSLAGGGGTNTVTASKTATTPVPFAFTLSDSALATSDGMSLVLAQIAVANLTGGSISNDFTVTGWTGTGTLTGAGSTTDRVILQAGGDITLSNAALSATGGPTLTLATIELADLIGGRGQQHVHHHWLDRHRFADRWRRDRHRGCRGQFQLRAQRHGPDDRNQDARRSAGWRSHN